MSQSGSGSVLRKKKSDPDLDPYSGKKSPIRIRTKGPGSKTVVFILLTNVIDFTSYDGFALFVLLLFSRPGKIHKEVPYAGHSIEVEDAAIAMIPSIE